MLTLVIPGLIIAYGLSEILCMFESDTSDDDDSETQSQGEEVQTITGVIGETGGSFSGGPGNDSVFAGPGDDILLGQGGDDVLTDGAGTDTLFGGSGDDLLDAVDAPQTLAAGDTLFGDEGDDRLVGDQDDTFTGGAGDDVFVVSQSDITNSAALITDYEDGETISIVVPEANATDTLINRLSSDGTATEIVFRGEVMAVVQGVTTPTDVAAQLAPNVMFG